MYKSVAFPNTNKMSSDGTFFLYDQLCEQQQKQATAKLSSSEQNELLSNLRKINKDGMEMVFVLIRVHSLRNNDTKLFEIPYKGEKINIQKSDEFIERCFDVKFDLKDLPLLLQRILLAFTKVHLEHAQLKN